jgi:hypothetical protein
MTVIHSRANATQLKGRQHAPNGTYPANKDCAEVYAFSSVIIRQIPGTGA